MMSHVQEGSSSTKAALVAGVAGSINLLLFMLALLLCYRVLHKRKVTRRGIILGVIQLQGPNIFSFKVLKSATKNFSEECKVGEGGFGDVYKRCTDMKNELLTESLLEYAWKLYGDGSEAMLIDETIEPSEYNVENGKKMIEIALRCTQSPVSLRPTMSEVVALLGNYALLEQK